MPNNENVVSTLCELWDKEMKPRMDELDTAGYYYWESVSYGWALAKGAGIDDAAEFAALNYFLL